MTLLPCVRARARACDAGLGRRGGAQGGAACGAACGGCGGCGGCGRVLTAAALAGWQFSQNALERCATPMLQRKFVALGGVDMLVNFISISVNDDVIASAAAALQMLEESSKDACMLVLQMGGAAVLFVQLRRTRNAQVPALALPACSLPPPAAASAALHQTRPRSC